MQIITHLSTAVGSYSEAWTVIRQHRMGKLILYACLSYLVLILLSAWAIWLGLDTGIDILLQWESIGRISNWLKGYPWLLTLSKIGLYLSSFFVFLSLYKYLFLAIASPLYAYLSERTAEAISGKVYPFQLGPFLHDIGRGILISMQNMLRQLLLNSFFYILSFLPVIGWIFGLLVLVNDCYYYGFSMLDYNCERERMNVGDARRFIRAHRGLAIGNGLVIYLSMMIPLIGIMVAAPLSAVAGTIAFYRHSSYSSTSPTTTSL